jgi:hypothetical protein
MEFGGRWHGEPGSRELRGVIGRDALTERWWARLPTFELLVAGYATPDEAVASILEAQALLTGRPLGRHRHEWSWPSCLSSSAGAGLMQGEDRRCVELAVWPMLLTSSGRY